MIGVVGKGSLATRMMVIAAVWITMLLLVGGFALNRTITNLIENNFDSQLAYIMTAMIQSAEIGPDGEVFFNRPLGDQRFLEPNSGLYWQISGQGHDDWPSRSLWDRSLTAERNHFDEQLHFHDSDQFAGEPLRIAERTIHPAQQRHPMAVHRRPEQGRN